MPAPLFAIRLTASTTQVTGNPAPNHCTTSCCDSRAPNKPTRKFCTLIRIADNLASLPSAAGYEAKRARIYPGMYRQILPLLFSGKKGGGKEKLRVRTSLYCQGNEAIPTVVTKSQIGF